MLAEIEPTVENYSECLTKARYIANIFSYLKDDKVHGYWADTCNEGRSDFDLADKAQGKNLDEKGKTKRVTRPPSRIVDYWEVDQKPDEEHRHRW